MTNFTSRNVSLHSLLSSGHPGRMDCGSAPLCGVLVLESGHGTGKYAHSNPVVHGVWPETGSYGSSKCIKPQDSSSPTKLAACYDDLSFETHEWQKHGVCAGVKDSEEFFAQVCSLSSSPLSVMSSSHANGDSLTEMASSLSSKGYPVFFVDTSSNSQIYLSACGNSEGVWTLSHVGNFGTACGGAAPTPPVPAPVPPPSPSGGHCVQGKRGPPCSSDNDCNGLSECLRCARSGYCTAEPLR